MSYAEKHGRGWRARWRDADGKLRSASGFASRRVAEVYGQNHEYKTVRYVVGTDDNQFAEVVFTVIEAAQGEREYRNESTALYMPGPDGELIRVRPWKVYELVEVELYALFQAADTAMP